MKNKFTFKTVRPTGSYSSFYPESHHIKFKKYIVGQIDDKSPRKIRLHVMKNDVITDDNPNCDWKWIQFRKDFNSIEEAKVWLNESIDSIMNLYTLYGNKDTGEECIIKNGVIEIKTK